ncbi:MAG: response regulator transcription factor [Synechococcaceae cyanobacterium]|nr:response regulator transcription factor [Synechococcaceae cyanobacterium]
MSASHNLRCVVVDDQVMFLQLLVTMLRCQQGLEVVGTALGAHEGQVVCQDLKPDVLILDLALPDGSGVVVLETLRRVNPRARAIILSAEACGFVCPEPLRGAVHAVVDKTRAYADLRCELARLRRELGVGDDSTLTPREQEILELIGAGFSNQEIAASLHLSRHTVETHRKRIASKLGLRGQDLIRYAALRLST